MAVTFPNIPPYDYLPVIKDLSTGQTTYVVHEYSAPESIEETLGIAQYKPDGDWWEEIAPLLSVIQRNKVATIPSVLVGQSVSTSADILEAFQNYSDGNVNFAGLLSAVSGRNIIGYVASALGFSIAKDSYTTVPDFWDSVSKAVFGELRDKDIKAPTLIKDGKTYVPKKMIAAIRKALYDAGLGLGDLVFPEVTAGDYTITEFTNTYDIPEALLKQIGYTYSNIIYDNLSDKQKTLADEIMSYVGGIGKVNLSETITNIRIQITIFQHEPVLPYATSVITPSNRVAYCEYTIPSGTRSLSADMTFLKDSGDLVWTYVSEFTYKNDFAGNIWVGQKSFSTISGDYVEAGNVNITKSPTTPTFTPTGDISEADTPLEKAYPAWAKNAIGFPAKVGTDENEEWYPLTIPDAIPWTDGYDDTQEKAQTGELADERAETRDEVLDNTLPDVITKPSTKTDVVPNPTPDPLPTIPSNVPSVDLGLAQLYNPTLTQLKSFSQWLWGVDFDVDTLKKLFADPMQAIIGLHAIYATPVEGGAGTIQVGYINSGVTSQVVKEQFTTINCGTVHIPESFGDVRDYSPYTKVHVYLPFIGIQELNTDDVMGGDVTITYKIDVLTGACLALISVKSKNVNGILYSYSGNCAIQLPISAGGYMQTVLSLIGAVGGVVTGGAVGGIGGAIAGGLAGVGNIQKTTVSVSGSLSSNAGAMGVKIPFITIRRPQKADAARYNEFYGYPANNYITLNSITGYCRVKDINLSVAGATEEEQQQIVSLLKEGVIL